MLTEANRKKIVRAKPPACHLKKTMLIKKTPLTSDYDIIDYEFRFENSQKNAIRIALDRQTNLIVLNHPAKPDWTLLEHEQCSFCPLNRSSYRYCPIALNISEMIDVFRNAVSYQHCNVKCKMPDRTYIKKLTVQEALFSIITIFISSSGCPIMAPSKPLARFHLPFANTEELLFQCLSVFFLRQYFRQKQGCPMDFSMQELKEHFLRVQIISQQIFNRISDVSHLDAEKNAFIMLDSFSETVLMEIEEGLASLESVFA